MKKEKLIQQIKSIIDEYGSFTIDEIEEYEINNCIGMLGDYTALAEYIEDDVVTIYIYNPQGVSIDSYDSTYEDLSVQNLTDLLTICKIWKKQNKDEEN
jgi:hypothetical protein